MGGGDVGRLHGKKTHGKKKRVEPKKKIEHGSHWGGGSHCPRGEADTYEKEDSGYRQGKTLKKGGGDHLKGGGRNI